MVPGKKSPRNIHFMGMGGSGLSGIAQIAAASGFTVSGCDMADSTPYLEKAQQSGIPFFPGHSPDHLQNIDLLAVTPAVFYQNQDHPELALAKKRGILIKWQDFLGQHLLPSKKVIAVAGTHGKSTTTALAGLLLEAAGLDPTVSLGATVPAWDNNIRIGQGEYFVCEADEFHDNFATFHPDIILLTLVEFDHPEYFGHLDNMMNHFQRFLDRLKPAGLVIYNGDSPLTKRLRFPKNSIAYHLAEFNLRHFPLGAPGLHNRLNALAIINLARHLHIPDPLLDKVLAGFHGLHRRMELLGQKNGIAVYDDYANHPSSFAATISAIRQVHRRGQLWAVIEPHTYSRLKILSEQLPSAFSQADHVIVSRIYPSREIDPGDFSGQDIVTSLHHPQARYLPEFSTIAATLKKEAQPEDVIVVMGSGNSYQLSRQILGSL